MSPTASPTWRGSSPAERAAERRERLLAAALDVFADQGFHAARVRDLCRAAGLSERFFYESFPDKDALLIAVAQGIVADLVHAAQPGLAIVADDPPAGMDAVAHAVVASLTDDPRRARILFVEVVGVSSAVEDRRRLVIAALADVVRATMARTLGDAALESVEVELVARGLIGAAQELLVAYVRGELVLQQDQLVAHTAALFAQANAVASALITTKDRT